MCLVRAVVTFAIIVGLSVSSFASAAEPIGDGTDVAGLNLNMSADQAQSFILAHNGAAKGTKLTATIGTQYYRQDFPVGSYFEIEPTAREQQRGAMDRPGEFVKVIYSPNSSDLIGIVRYQGYKKGSFPTKDSVINAVLQKYGKPISTGSNQGNYVWVSGARIRPNMDGFWYDERSGCSLTGFAGGESFLYERDGAFYQNGLAAFESGDQVSADTSSSFTVVLNNINRNSASYKNCGVVFQVNIGYADNRDYVSSISERIVDFGRANAELSQVNDNFWRKANEAKAAKLKSDSSTQPKL